MQDSNEFEELLLKYVADDITRQEQGQLFEMIETDSNKKRCFEETLGLWRLSALERFSEIEITNELAILKDRIKKNSAKIIPLIISENVVDKTSSHPNVKRLKIISGVAVAASLLFIFILTGHYFKTNGNYESRIPILHRPNDQIITVHHEINQTGKTRHIKLPDGSEVILYDKSEISYPSTFTLKRDVVLIGKARFKVAKDKARPFSVTNENIITTALGTQFTVGGYPNSKKIRVRLHEGKVVIRTLHTSNQLCKEYYLLPGDEFLFDKQKLEVSIINKNTRKGNKTDYFINRDVKNSVDWFMFSNQYLTEVFDQLSAIYNTRIIYTRKDLANRKFIGKFSQVDSLETILNQIAILNDLRIKKERKSFIVYK